MLQTKSQSFTSPNIAVPEATVRLWRALQQSDGHLPDLDQFGAGELVGGHLRVKFVRDEDGQEKEYTIVGEGESDHRALSISFKSPVARALTGKRVGDVVLVHRPAGEIELEIVDLKFAGRRWDA